jgi:streptomycin 6-kinase
MPLSTLEDDEQATTIAASVMRRIWRPVREPHGFPTVADWGRGFARHLSLYGDASPIPRGLFERGRALYHELAASAAPPVLLHGDLHHDNILSATREPWLAVDPKGLMGEPAYETGAFLRNPHKRLAALPDARSLLARRIALLAEALEIERARIHGWGLATAVLSACWTFEDGPDGDASIALGVASALARISRQALDVC